MVAKRKSAAKRALKVRVIDLKKLTKLKSDTQLRKALETAARSKVAIIVLNAPFKLQAA